MKELHDRAKRSRRSFIVDLNNQRDVSENKSHREAEIIKDALGNVTEMQKTKGVVRLYSGYFNNDGGSLKRTLNKMNISDSQSSLDKGSFLNHRFINLTITSSIADKANISEPRYPSITELNLNNYSIDNTSFFLVKFDLQTHLPERINQVSKINSKKLGQRSPTEKIPKTFAKDIAVSNASVVPIHFSTDSGADDSRKFEVRNGKSDRGKLSARKKSRLGTDDGQSEDAGEERREKGGKRSPEGNTSRGFDTMANESRRIYRETIAAGEKRERLETSGKTQKKNLELIRVFERPYQKQEAEARLSQGRTRRNDDAVDESTENANAGGDDFSRAIDRVIDAKPTRAARNASEIGESIIPKDRIREDLASMTAGDDLRKQQQMVLPLSATNGGANKSNGNSDADGIDIRVVGSNGNETMNVKEGTVTGGPREYRESDNHLRRRLLWIPAVAVADAETDDSTIKSTGSVLNSAIDDHIEHFMDENRQQNEMINSADSGKVLIRVKRDNNVEESSETLRNNFNPRTSDANHQARYKRSTYSFEDLESNNAAEDVDVAKKKVAVNHDEKQENNEEYENVERVKGDYDSEEDIMEGIN